MIDTSNLPFFLAAATVLIVMPGPSVLYIVARSLDQGRLSGIVSMLGVAAGGLFHVAAAALGLSALLASSAAAFNTIKYAGAAYLILLGVRRLIAPADAMPEMTTVRRKPSRVFYEGMLVNVLNPKTALFFLAFLPQFVTPSIGPVSIQIIALGAIFVAIALISDSLYALLAGGLGNWLRGRSPAASGMRMLSGGVYIGLGLATALSGSGRGK